MKTTVLKEGLKNALAVVERVTAKSSTLPILGNILVSTKKNSLELSATDLEMGIRYTVLAKNEEEGSLVLPSRLLSQFVSLLPENQVVLATRDNGLEIESAEQHAFLVTQAAEDFPIIPSLKGDERSVEVETKPFCLALGQVAGMTGQTQARPEISGVFFAFSATALRIAATDSFRLAEKTISFAKAQAEEESFILPQKTARELVSILGEHTGKTKIYFSPNQVLFECSFQDAVAQPSLQIVSRLIEGEYPQYQDIIPKEYATKVSLSREELTTHIKAASLFAGKMSEVRCTVDPKKKGVEFLSRSSDIGEHTSFVPGEVSGERVEIAFNWKFLLDGLLHMRSKDVEIGLNGSESPAVLQPLAREGYLYVVMPIKA